MNKIIIVRHFLSSFIFDESLIAEITANENKILKQLTEMQEAQTINTQVLDESIESNTKKIIYYTIGFLAFVGICYLFMYGNDGGDGAKTLMDKFTFIDTDIYTRVDDNYLKLLDAIKELSNKFLYTNNAVSVSVDKMFSQYNTQITQSTLKELVEAIASNGKQLTTISKMLETINKNNPNSPTCTGDITEL